MAINLPFFIGEGDTTSNVKIQENFSHLQDKLNNEPLSIVSYADEDAPNSTLYFSTTAGKLVWKDSSGVVNNLY